MRDRIHWLTSERLLRLEKEFPETYDRETTVIVFAIRALAQYINDEANVWLAPYGLNAGTYNYLAMLYAAENRTLTQNEIRKLVHTTHATVTQMVGALERDGFVTRRRNPGDGRSMLITLTPMGVKTMQEALPAHHVAINSRLRLLSKSRQRTLMELLGAVREGFEALDSGLVDATSSPLPPKRRKARRVAG
jgi:DNA-binding MarR family transcriptional regulator